MATVLLSCHMQVDCNVLKERHGIVLSPQLTCRKVYSGTWLSAFQGPKLLCSSSPTYLDGLWSWVMRWCKMQQPTGLHVDQSTMPMEHSTGMQLGTAMFAKPLPRKVVQGEGVLKS